MVEVGEAAIRDLPSPQEKIDFLLREGRGTLTKSHVRANGPMGLIKLLHPGLLLVGAMLDHLRLEIVHRAQKVSKSKKGTTAEDNRQIPYFCSPETPKKIETSLSQIQKSRHCIMPRNKIRENNIKNSVRVENIIRMSTFFHSSQNSLILLA